MVTSRKSRFIGPAVACAVLFFAACDACSAVAQDGNQVSTSAQEAGQPRVVARNQQLELNVASHLRAQGLGKDSRILIMAAGNDVYLLGVVPDAAQKQQAEQAAGQVEGVQQVASLLAVGGEPEPKSDLRLRRDIEQELGRLEAASANDIRVHTYNGEVILEGRVGSWQALAAAVQAAFNAGTQYVMSELSVSASPSPVARPNGPRRPGEPNALETAPDYAPSTTDANRLQPQWLQSAQDRRIQQQVAAQLQSGLGEDTTYVLVWNGQAFLLGRVQTNEQKRQAEMLARQVEGVERVKSRLTVAEQGWRQQEDSRIAGAIREELAWSPFVDSDLIDVEVNQGVATMTGTVRSFGEMLVAIENAFEGGARAVRNQLRSTEMAGEAGSRTADGAATQGIRPPGPTNTSQARSREDGMSPAETALAQRVERQLQQQLTGNHDVYVIATDSTVWLNGVVESRAQSRNAERIAGSVSGVRAVRNNLVVGEVAGNAFRSPSGRRRNLTYDTGEYPPRGSRTIQR